MPGNLMQTIWVFDSNVEPVFHLPSTFIPIDGDPGATGSSCRASLLLCLTKKSMKTFQIDNEIFFNEQCHGKTHLDNRLTAQRGMEVRLLKK